ncbi:thiamine-phosphate kinase [Acinetobacter qingfengensis]|uniref:Thiamine-monophosphate kinase n=1 Tax=Acinetobacter qingfengensis TaxID=1262585 RepID=A0A1E7R534_9GAMM|nr:thiamine-phosphate kinase [Acinetobacter qingfengensis]KAA8732400.1 thiamine-phosphate kinase [Acinetobacter qingfengensis]OEY94395.1 thiamine-phosphate kinase [Acinetobacter qingfengensis]
MTEFSIISRYFQSLTTQDISVGIGDDCAVFSPPENQQLVSCIDTLVAGRHFLPDAPAHAIGWKSVAVNLSDLAAMGATPHSVLLALSLPTLNEDWLAEFSRGIADCCQQYGVQLIGGDTTQNPTLTISITALGWVAPHQAILRSGAQVGDFIAVTGQIGSAAYALRYPDSALQNTLDYPIPQVEFGLALRGYASSMLDVSDGLAQDLGHILHASQVGARIQFEQIPMADEIKTLALDTQKALVLAGGDDYQLCFTISAENLNKFTQKFDFKPYIIGQIESGSVCHFFNQQQAFTLKQSGYQHFATTSH